jgi:hypothetical protein
MFLAYEKRLTPVAGGPGKLPEEAAAFLLNIDVVFTSVQATLAAFQHAGELARHLNARITLVVPQVVPYPAPLESPPVLLEFSEKRFRDLASQSPVDTAVRIYLCRDRWEVLKQILKPRSLVVIGGRKRWWPTAESRLARRLHRNGQEVVFAPTE